MNNNKGQIPKFKNDADEARYWDEHDLTEHLDELEPAEVRVKELLEHTLTIRVSKDDLIQLREMGQQSGMGTTTVARFLIRQSLRQPSAQIGLGAALADPKIQAEIQALFEEGKIPPEGSDDEMYILQAKRMAYIGDLMTKVATRAVRETLAGLDHLGLKEKPPSAAVKKETPRRAAVT